jgi:hypothetical protein
MKRFATALAANRAITLRSLGHDEPVTPNDEPVTPNDEPVTPNDEPVTPTR